jgi:acyl-CoA hydrolase
MSAISYVNQLFGNEELKRLQRQAARFINTGLIVTLTGAVASDGLEDGRVLSGVGGQYNFVAMAPELEDGLARLKHPVLLKQSRPQVQVALEI